MFSQGVVQAESCQQRKVAGKLYRVGRRETIVRRLQRFISNRHIDLGRCFAEWTRWVVSSLALKEVVLLVDETKLSDRMGAMVVGLAYEKRCIPLAWRCYKLDEYPVEGQVKVIAALLEHVAAGLPEGIVPLVEADRGIGTSPALIRAVVNLNWRYLFRITRQSKIVMNDGTEHTIYDMVQPGEIWTAEGKVFKKRGKIPARALALWEKGQDGPWALVTNDPELTGHEYAIRNWQEQSFRDLKSQGWQWERSLIRIPEHADRLLLVLSVAYAWVLALGSYFIHSNHATPLQKRKDGTWRRRLSVFQEGLHHFAQLRRSQKHVCLKLFFAPDKRLC